MMFTKSPEVIYDYGFARMTKKQNLKSQALLLALPYQQNQKDVNSDMRKEVAACSLRLHGGENSTTNVENIFSSALETSQIEKRK